MSAPRREFLRTLGLGAAAMAAAPMLPTRLSLLRALERGELGEPRGSLAGHVRLDRNENPVGPFPGALRAVTARFGEASRYPYEAEAELVAAIAKAHGVTPEHVVMGCGSGELLQVAVHAFTTPARGLVAAAPTFETPEGTARALGRPVSAIPVTGALALDLDRMAQAARGAGLVFLCNPNNPTGTVHGAAAVREFLARVRRESPGTVVLVDEAYHEYVDDPSYATMVPEAVRDPQVIVSRTFSKVFGLAGMRVGYMIAAPETAAGLRRLRLGGGVNQLAAAAALASLADAAAIRAEQARNRAVRAMVRTRFEELGFAPGPSETNFLFVDIKRDIGPVRQRFRDAGIAVGRPFPPFGTHLRVSMGTAEEMARFAETLPTALA